MEYFRDHYRITTDKSLMDIDAIHRMLLATPGAGDLPRSVLEAAVRSSLCWGVFQGDKQIGFARVISDYATFAYLCDVVIDTNLRGRGLGLWLVKCIMEHPQLQGLQRWLVYAPNSQEFYQKLGFQPLKEPLHFMEIFRAEIYHRQDED